MIERIKANAAYPDRTIAVEISGADHFYDGHEEELGNTIVQWLDHLKV